MLSPHNIMLLDTIFQDKTRKYIREAQLDHLTSQIKPHRQSRLSKQMCRGLHHLGHLLIDSGERLERSETSRAT